MCFLGSDAHANAFFFSLPVLCSQEHQEERRANLPPSLHKLTVHIQKFVMTCSALHCSSISHNMTAQVQIPGFFFFQYFGYALPTGQALPADPA